MHVLGFDLDSDKDVTESDVLRSVSSIERMAADYAKMINLLRRLYSIVKEDSDAAPREVCHYYHLDEGGWGLCYGQRFAPKSSCGGDPDRCEC